MDPHLVTLVDSSFVLANPQLVGHDSDRLRVLRREYSAPFAGTPAHRRGKFRATDTDLETSLVTTPRSNPRHLFDDNNELATKEPKLPKSRTPPPSSREVTSKVPSRPPSSQ